MYHKMRLVKFYDKYAERYSENIVVLAISLRAIKSFGLTVPHVSI